MSARRARPLLMPARRSTDRHPRRLPVLAIAVLSLGGCTSPLETTDDRVVSARAEEARSRDALNNFAVQAESLAKNFAISLGSVDERRRLASTLRRSRVTREHKILAQDYLAERSLSLRAVAESDGYVSVALERAASTAKNLDSLELYLPIRSQRDNWNGDQPVLVAVHLDENLPSIAYSDNGSRIALSPETSPEQTVVVLASVESDFSAPLSAKQLPVNAGLRDAVGTWDGSGGDESCDPETADRPCDYLDPGLPPIFPPYLTAPIPKSPGIWLQHLSLQDDGEGILIGDPEIEIFIFARMPDGREYLAQLAGHFGSGSHRFRVNDGEWLRPFTNPFQPEEGLIISLAQLGELEAQGAEISMHVWENDKEPGVIKTNDQKWYDFLTSQVSVIPKVFKAKKSLAICVLSWGAATNFCLEGREAAEQVVAKVVSVFVQGDDFLGVAQISQPNPMGYVYSPLSRGSGGHNGFMWLYPQDQWVNPFSASREGGKNENKVSVNSRGRSSLTKARQNVSFAGSPF